LKTGSTRFSASASRNDRAIRAGTFTPGQPKLDSGQNAARRGLLLHDNA
jgi:hypothetical protein